MKWISVEDGLPNKSTPMDIWTVLVWVNDCGGYFTRGWYYNSTERWYIDGTNSDFSDVITHWCEVTSPV